MSEEKKVTIFDYLQNSGEKVVYVEQLRNQGFSDEEIRSLTHNLPDRWNYSEPSWKQMSDPDWWKANFSKIIQMQNRALCFYFYK